jgi:hypothetical protein
MGGHLMLRLSIKSGALGLLAVALLGGSPTGNAADDFKPEEGYTSLFNGKDLTGWVYKAMPKESLEGKTETSDKRFQVMDGIIVVNEGKGIKDLYTIKQFPGEFHLKLEFRAAPRADSGLYIRGPQLQVRDYPTVGPYKPKSFKAGDWNELDVTLTKDVLFTTVNGKNLTDTDALEVTVKNGKAEAKLNGKEVPPNNIQVQVSDAALCKCNGEVLEKAFKIQPKTGGIGLQAEVGKFEFRRLRIKELPGKTASK